MDKVVARVLGQVATYECMTKVRLSSFPGVGIGIEAIEPLEAGDEVVRIPWELARDLSADRAWEDLKDEAFVPRLLDLARSLPLTQIQKPQLVGGIMLSMLLLKERQSDTAKPYSHAKAIPPDLAVPIFWNQNQLEELQMSPLIQLIQQRRELIANVFGNVVNPVLPQISAANFAWAYSTVLSRAAFSIEKNIPFSIVPVVDCFNHNLDTNTHGQCELAYDQATNAFMIYALTAASPGSQLFISYGQHGNAELLSRYGFVLDDNPYDALTVATPAGNLVLSKQSKTTLPSNQAFASLLLQQLEAVASSYRTTLEEDTAVLGEIQQTLQQGFCPQVYARKCATLVRLGEKQLLHRDIEALSQQVA